MKLELIHYHRSIRLVPGTGAREYTCQQSSRIEWKTSSIFDCRVVPAVRVVWPSYIKPGAKAHTRCEGCSDKEHTRTLRHPILTRNNLPSLFPYCTKFHNSRHLCSTPLHFSHWKIPLRIHPLSNFQSFTKLANCLRNIFCCTQLRWSATWTPARMPQCCILQSVQAHSSRQGEGGLAG